MNTNRITPNLNLSHGEDVCDGCFPGGAGVREEANDRGQMCGETTRLGCRDNDADDRAAAAGRCPGAGPGWAGRKVDH